MEFGVVICVNGPRVHSGMFVIWKIDKYLETLISAGGVPVARFANPLVIERQRVLGDPAIDYRVDIPVCLCRSRYFG